MYQSRSCGILQHTWTPARLPRSSTLASQPHETPALPGDGRTGSTAGLLLPAGNILQAPVPGSRGRFAEGRCGQRSNVSSCPQRLQHQPIGLVWPFGPVTQWPGSRNHYPLLLNLLPGTALQTTSGHETSWA